MITAEAAALSDGTMRRLVHDIINGMSELCKCGITHRDLKHFGYNCLCLQLTSLMCVSFLPFGIRSFNW